MMTENVTATGTEMATANATIEEMMNDVTENATAAAETMTMAADGMVLAMTMIVVTAEKTERALADGKIEGNAAVIVDEDVKAKKDGPPHLIIAPRSLSVSERRQDGTSMHLDMNNIPQCRQSKLVCNRCF
jgi:hypothetical protein